MKRPVHLTLVDSDRFSALVSRCTEQRERAEKAEARIEVLDRVLNEVKEVAFIEAYDTNATALTVFHAVGTFIDAALAAKEET